VTAEDGDVDYDGCSDEVMSGRIRQRSGGRPIGQRNGTAAAEIISLYRLYSIIASRDGSDGGTAVVVAVGRGRGI